MENAKLRLSEEELRLVSDPSFILTKNAIIQKVYLLFGLLADDFRDKSLLPEEVERISPKIAKGENYLGLPYVMLDYPRFFSAEHTMAIRCFFWWGNFFSITLHLHGRYTNLYSSPVIKSLRENKVEDWYYCINENQWQHDFKENNYAIISKDNVETIASAKKDFLKIAKKIPLIQWDDAYDFYLSNFSVILSILNAQ